MIALLLTLTLSQTAPTWPTLSVQWTVPIEGKQRVGTWEVQLQRLAVTEAPDEVLARFAQSFVEAGLFIPPPEAQVQLYRGRTSLTALEPNSMTSYTVTAWKEEGGLTQVLTSLSVLGPPSPLPKGAAAVARQRRVGVPRAR